MADIQETGWPWDAMRRAHVASQFIVWRAPEKSSPMTSIVTLAR